MTRLLRDRYYTFGADDAWDLATGERVRVTAAGGEEASVQPPPLAALIEVLDHGHEGAPRWVVADDTSQQRWSTAAVALYGERAAPRGGRLETVSSTIRRAAADARARGYVPVAVDVYLRLRNLLAEELRERTLLLIARPGIPLARARAAFVDAAARAPRPHVLLTFLGGVAGRRESARLGPPTSSLPRRGTTETARATAGLPDGSRQSAGTRGATAGRSSVAGSDSGSRGLKPPRRASPCVVREARAVYGAHALPPRPTTPLTEDVMRHLVRGSRADEFARAGRHAAAERLLRDVGGALVRRKALAPAAQTLVRLGRLLLERGRAADAETVFGEAAAHGEAAQHEPLMLHARVWQAAARTDAAHLTAAESLCRAVLLTGALPEAERTRAEATLARVLLWQGRMDEAIALERTWGPPFLDADLSHASTEVEAQAKVAGGSELNDGAAFLGATAVRLLLEGGRVFEAGQRARALVTLTRDSADPLTRLIGLITHVRFLTATGDLVLAEGDMRELHRAARDARAPLRLARARLIWVDALRRAGRTRDANRELALLTRLRAAAPPLLRNAIDHRLRGRNAAAAMPRVPVVTTPSAATSLITIAQREEGDRDALVRLLEFTADALQTSRIDLCAADAGPVSTVLTVGSGLATRLGVRVLDAGIAIGPETGDPSHEIGLPVRLGSKLLAAVVVRWPVDRTPPPNAADLLAVMAAVAAPRIESLLAASREVSQAATAIPELVGSSAAIAEVKKAVARAAAAPFAVLIEGESGVGKELVARAIHHLSVRRERRFCDVNCAALPDELLESELFGHARGAFTGAVADRAGLVEEADGGTLFLDEVADLSARAQAKLLRVVQQQEVRRVGEAFSRKVDVRIVSAANRDMRAEAGEGRFRQDLLYRLDVVRIRMPPLRERPEDVPLLAAHFWRVAAARVGSAAVLSHPVIAALSRYHWPGNVRELQNVMATLAVAAPARGLVRPALLPATITGAAAVTSAHLADARAQFERRFIEVALARAGGSRTRAARDVGLSRQGLLKILARLRIT